MSKQIPLAELCVSINLNNTPKAGSYHKATKLSTHILNKSWSPIIFRNSYRNQDHFLFSDWAVLDYDDGETTIEAAQNTFCDCVHIIGTTKRHTPEKHRFRVCIPWTERIENLEVFRYSQSKIIEEHSTDGQCKDGARFYFPCKEIFSINAEGFRASVETPPKKVFKPPFEHSKTGFSSAVTFFMKNIIHKDKNGHDHRNTQIYQVSKDLFRIGLDKRVVYEIIIKSPTYRDNRVSGGLENEIQETMESAWRSVKNG